MLALAAAVVFVSLRNSAVAAPELNSEPTVSVRTVLRHRAYRAALFSNFATGWAAFGLRIALVPLFVVEALGHSAGLAGLAGFAMSMLNFVPITHDWGWKELLKMSGDGSKTANSVSKEN